MTDSGMSRAAHLPQKTQSDSLSLCPGPHVPFAGLCTIQAFWRLMAKHKFSELRDRSCLHVFKDDIRPLWEDPKNHCGGHFKLTASNQNTTETMWLEVVLNLLGQQFPYRDLVVCPFDLMFCEPTGCPPVPAGKRREALFRHSAEPH